MSKVDIVEKSNGDQDHVESGQDKSNITASLSSTKENDTTNESTTTASTTATATTSTTTAIATTTTITTSSNVSSSNTEGEAEKPMSKSQQKKRKRYEKLMAIKKRRKQQDKDAKIAKAKAEGRDLDAERKLQEERTQSGEGRRKREERWQERMKSADTCFKICVDCSFEDQMTPKEIGSLSNQVRYCYAANKSSHNPVHLSVSSLSGATYGNLTKVCGFPDQWRAFTCSDKPLLELHPEKSNVVYLTSDSDYTLEHLDNTKTYVIGGIVDRNRLKGLTTVKAKELGITTARLPIDEYLHLCATKVLTCNHVFEILLKYCELDNDWKSALLDVLPARKDITGISE